MKEIFDFVYSFLKWIYEITGFTYREVNIIVYYIIIPFLFIFLISKLYNKKYIINGFMFLVTLTLIIIPDFEFFSDFIFEKSVSFLKLFQNIGLNYVQASVIICVVIPAAVIIWLLYLKSKNKLKTI